jgi:hypothetical protein
MISVQDALSVIISVAVIVAIADKLLQMSSASFDDKNARWYLLHALTNTVIAVMVWPDMLTVFRDPVNSMALPYSDVPLAITVGLHVFHCLSQAKTLTFIDWAHHLISNMLVAGLCFPFIYGPLSNWGVFFVCGFPGGVDYYLLAFVKFGWLTSAQEKRANRFLNVWIRAPGILCWVAFAYVCWASGKTSMPDIVLAAQSFLNVFNALYFADRVVANEAICSWCATNGVDKKEVEQRKRQQSGSKKTK